MAKTKNDRNSVTEQVKAYQASVISVELPEGLEFANAEEELIWSQFTRIRMPEDWRDFDLVLLYKIVKLEALVRREMAAAEKEGFIIENQRGTPIENPRLRVCSTFVSQQMMITRSMSLTQQHDPRTINARGKNVASTPTAINEARKETVSLLATPRAN